MEPVFDGHRAAAPSPTYEDTDDSAGRARRTLAAEMTRLRSSNLDVAAAWTTAVGELGRPAPWKRSPFRPRRSPASRSTSRSSAGTPSPSPGRRCWPVRRCCGTACGSTPRTSGGAHRRLARRGAGQAATPGAPRPTVALFGYRPVPRVFWRLRHRAGLPRVLGQYLAWTGDRDTGRTTPTDREGGSSRWLKRYGDLDRDGFLEYDTRSPPTCSAAGASVPCPGAASDPFSYHRGSVWPVGAGTTAIGLARYGRWPELHRLAEATFAAAALFEGHRLPEVISGLPRDETHPHPGVYPNACSPQAWSASAIVALVQALLCLRPAAPLRTIVVDPHLPDWLPDLELYGVQVGGATFDLTVRRHRRGHVSVRTRGDRITVLRQPTFQARAARLARPA